MYDLTDNRGLFSTDILNYADQLSDNVIEEVFKMLSFQTDDNSDSDGDGDDDDDDDDDDEGLE